MSDSSEISVVISWRSGLLGSVEMADTPDTELTGVPNMALTLATDVAGDRCRQDEALLGENERPFREDIELMHAEWVIPHKCLKERAR